MDQKWCKTVENRSGFRAMIGKKPKMIKTSNFYDPIQDVSRLLGCNILTLWENLAHLQCNVALKHDIQFTEFQARPIFQSTSKIVEGN